MSDFQLQPGHGQLFRNKDKKNDRHPNLKGTALVDLNNGQLAELDISAWTKPTRTGDKFLSLSVKIKNVKPAPAPNDGSDLEADGFGPEWDDEAS